MAAMELSSWNELSISPVRSNVQRTAFHSMKPERQETTAFRKQRLEIVSGGQNAFHEALSERTVFFKFPKETHCSPSGHALEFVFDNLVGILSRVAEG